MHGIIVNGGTVGNVIPDAAVLLYRVRATSSKDLAFLKGKLVEFIHAAALSTGCTVDIDFSTKDPRSGPYMGMIHSRTMSHLYKKYSAAEGVIFVDGVPSFSGSTDMGNVSLVVPSIHPSFYIGQPYMIHTRDFARLAGSADAQKYTLIAAKSLALTAVELYRNKEVRDRAKQEFQLQKRLLLD
ncbi:putative Peptidase M20 domain-containing protein 2 [Hypsibius exemplaris]|uniref:Peptidase M20 domain-containing protein 2 n=1 Tax=Hypsibius exemplaris TaxID=2072580 RepID=A0A1W0XDQ5_HYPEX|nr:putative Peptidase M20 domain-containing protein 2 [Hypsibius exemplaris]